MASQGASVKTASVSKQNCLHIGLSWWGIKGIIVPVTGVVTVGTLRFGALRRLWETRVAQGCSVSSRVDVREPSQCAHLGLQLQGVFL